MKTMNWLNQVKVLFVCLCYMATSLQLRVNNSPCPRKRMQINLHKIDQFWDTNKQGGGGEGVGSHSMRSQLTTAPIQLRTFEDNESSILKGVS